MIAKPTQMQQIMSKLTPIGVAPAAMHGGARPAFIARE